MTLTSLPYVLAENKLKYLNLEVLEIYFNHAIHASCIIPPSANIEIKHGRTVKLSNYLFEIKHQNKYRRRLSYCSTGSSHKLIINCVA